MQLQIQKRVIPNVFQQEALKKLEETKEKRGVVVMPTGTGKTFLAVLWFKRILEKDNNAKLLFICHNQDILSQANETEFQKGLKNFEIEYGYYNAKMKDIKQVTFATTQTLTRGLNNFNKDSFDYIIVDESHHYQAKSFKKVVEYFNPKFLLGLTATPNRTDNKSIFKVLGKKIYEEKVSTAIKKELLTKINYWCVDNDIDFTNVKLNGNNYDEKDLNKKICVKEYDESILKEYRETLKNKFEKNKTICFCATVEHTHRMAKLFNENGISAVGLTGRHRLKEDLIQRGDRDKIVKGFKDGKYDIIFVRDLFNEGVDIPDCDSIMMLRPTQSHTIFTQQIGRGLRKSEGKEDVLILDFTGNARRCVINFEALGEMIELDVVDRVKSEVKERETGEIEFVSLGCKVRLNQRKFNVLRGVRNKYDTSSKNLVECFRILKDKLDRIPTKKEMIKLLGFSHFNYTFLLQMLGEKTKGIIAPTKEEIIKEYFELKKKLGRQPKIIELTANGYYIPKYFGNAEKFYNEIGEQYRLQQSKVSKDELIKEYFRVKEMIRKQPTSAFFSNNKKNGIRYNLKKYEREFGGWKDFLISINEPINQNNVFAKDVSEKELLDNLYMLKKKLKRDVSWSDLKVKRFSKFGAGKYNSKIGKEEMQKMLKKVNGKYRELNIPVNKLIKELKDKAKELEHIPTTTEFGNRAIPLKRKLGMGWGDIVKLVFGEDCNYNFMGDKTSTKICPTCNKEFKYFSCSKPVPINCSRKCRNIYLNEKMVGEKGEWAINEYKKGRAAQSISRELGLKGRNPLITYFKFKGIKIRNRKESNIAVKKYKLLNKNIKIISQYKPKTIIPIKPKQKGNKNKSYEGLVKSDYSNNTSKEDKIDIRERILSKIKDGDNVLLLESPDLTAIKEIEKRGIKPKKIVIPNHLEFNKLAQELRRYKTELNIECINTSALQYLVDSEEKFDFIWLDYCGAFSYYMKDLDILFAKHFGEMKLILTYNLFDPAKEDENYYFTRVIDYVLDKISGKSKIRLINDVTYRYKKNMYNIGFEIKRNEGVKDDGGF